MKQLISLYDLELYPVSHECNFVIIFVLFLWSLATKEVLLRENVVSAIPIEFGY